MGISVSLRLATVLPELLALTVPRRRSGADRMVAAGIRLGGFAAWAVEQGRYCGELVGPDTSAACGKNLLPPQPPPRVPGISILRALPITDTSVAVFEANGESSRPLRLLMGLPGQQERLFADAKLAEFMIGMLPGHVRHIARADLVRLIEDIALAAVLDGDLGEEAKGLGIASQLEWFDAPRLVSQSRGLLIVTDLPGVPFETLPIASQAAAYHMAVSDWARMLLDGGILSSTLRRDRLVVQETRLGLTRWAGVRRASAGSVELIRCLVLAEFGPDGDVRAEARDRVSRLLSDGLGMEGALDDVVAFCLSLISGDHRLSLARRQFSRITVEQSARYRSADRLEMFLLLRQLVWLRDLGLACGVSDLSAPWLELAPGLQRRPED